MMIDSNQKYFKVKGEIPNHVNNARTNRQNQLKSLHNISNLFQTVVSRGNDLILDYTQLYQILILLIMYLMLSIADVFHLPKLGF